MTISIGVHAQGSTAGGSTTVTTGAVNTQSSGSCIYVFVGSATANTLLSVTDNKGNGNYTQVGTLIASATALFNATMWKKDNATGGTGHTWTATTTAGTQFQTIFAVEIISALTSNSTDQQNRQTDTATPFVSPSVTTTQASEVIIGCEFDNRNGTAAVTIGGSFAPGDKLEEVTNSASLLTGAMCAKVVASIAAYQLSWTTSDTVTDSTDHIITVFDAGGGQTNTATAMWWKA